MTVEPIENAPASSDTTGCIIGELRALYYGYFDNYFFINLMEQNTFNTTRLRSIENMLGLQSIYARDSVIYSEGIEALEEIILTAKRFILPELREKLKISGFYRKQNSNDDMVKRRMFSYTFPYNLQRLEELTEELKKSFS